MISSSSSCTNKRPMSYYVEASKRSRKKRREEKNFYMSTNSKLEMDIAALDATVKDLQKEVDLLLHLKKVDPELGNRDAGLLLKESLKLQLAQYRTLTANVKKHAVKINQVSSQIETVGTMKENISYMFDKLGLLLQKTKHNKLCSAVKAGPGKRAKKEALYRETLKAVCEEYSVKNQKIEGSFEPKRIIQWLPEFDLSKLITKCVEMNDGKRDKTVRIDIEDLPVPMRLLQLMLKKIDIFAVMMRCQNALKAHLKENIEPLNQITRLFGEPAAPQRTYLTPDPALKHFNVNVCCGSRVSFLSAANLDNQFGVSQVVQALTMNPNRSIEEEEMEGNSFLRGLSFCEGSDSTKTSLCFVTSMKREYLLNSSLTGRRFHDMGAAHFMKEGGEQSSQMFDLLESILKCGLYVYNYIEDSSFEQTPELFHRERCRAQVNEAPFYPLEEAIKIESPL